MTAVICAKSLQMWLPLLCPVESEPSEVESTAPRQDGISHPRGPHSPLGHQCHASTPGTVKQNSLARSGWQQGGGTFQSHSGSTFPVSFPLHSPRTSVLPPELPAARARSPLPAHSYHLWRRCTINESLGREMKAPGAKSAVCEHSLLPRTQTNPYRRRSPSQGIS